MRSSPFSTLLFSAWPDLDQRLWRHGTTGGAFLDTDGPGVRWRPATKATVVRAYGCALAWLRQEGALDEAQAPRDRWTPDRLRAYIQSMRGRLRPATVRHRIVHLERALAVLAPDSDRAMFRIAARNLLEAPDHSAKRARLQDPVMLLELGLQLMQAAERDRAANIRHAAAQFRTGLQVALLALRPLRMGNFTNIRIGINLVRRYESWWLLFERDETKTKQVIEEPFPVELAPYLDRYLSLYRSCLAGRKYTGDHLWVGYRFTPQAQHTLKLAIGRVTKRAFGVAVNPHLFRDSAATWIATNDPKAIGLAAAVLGHRAPATAERHYNLASSASAARSHAEVIRARRRCGDRRATLRSKASLPGVDEA